MPLLMPDGKPADSIDRVMLMSMWVKFLNEEKSKNRPQIISAGMGKPTFAINSDAVKASLSYWTKILAKNRTVQALIEADENLTDDTVDSIAEIRASIDYDSPQGNAEARKILATASSEWYETKITQDQVLLTVGGAAGIYTCFQVLKKRYPDAYIATPVPYYSLYEKSPNKLHLIDVMRSEGYKLTAKLLKESLEEARRNGKSICALLICDPNNPLSSIVPPEEWGKIAIVLREHPKILIILDEAYAEMQLNGKKYVSLITVAPDLKERTIIFRSATKGLSAAGERMAATFIFDSDLMREMIATSVNLYGHAPISSQIVYATALSSLTDKTLEISARYHKKQVDYVSHTLKAIRAEMPDAKYEPVGTFYVLCDLSDLYGMPLPNEAVRALGKNGKAETDEEIAYALFRDGIMIMPLSYFGVSNKAGYFRITCSEGLLKLKQLMNRLANRLVIVREMTQSNLLANLIIKIDCLKLIRPKEAHQFLVDLSSLLESKPKSKDVFLNARNLKDSNETIRLLLRKLDQQLLSTSTSDPTLFGGKKLFREYSEKQSSKVISLFEHEIYSNWYQYIGHNYNEEEARIKFSKLSSQEKLNFVPWKAYIMMQLGYEKNTIEMKPIQSPLLSRL